MDIAATNMKPVTAYTLISPGVKLLYHSRIRIFRPPNWHPGSLKKQLMETHKQNASQE